MVERTVFGQKQSEQQAPRVCTWCKRESEQMIEVFVGGEFSPGGVLKSQFCSFECELRSKGVEIEDDGIEKLLERLLRGEKDDARDSCRTETIE
jgi:hypothetical protein